MKRPLAVLAVVLAGLGPAGAQAATFETDPVVSCLVLPWETIDLAAAIDGIVDELLVERGDVVQAGELLVRLNDDVQQAYYDTMKARAEDSTAVQQAQIRMDVAGASLDRNRALFERQQVTADQWDQIRGAYEVAVVELEAARAARHLAQLEVARAETAIRQTQVRAPSEAVVLARSVAVGERIGVDPLLKLAVIKKLRVEVFARAASYAAWIVGDTVQLVIQHPAPRRIEARIRAVDPVSDAGTGVVGVQMEVDNADVAILAGQQCGLADFVADPTGSAATGGQLSGEGSGS